MKLNATISTPQKRKGPFIQNGKRERFVQPNKLERDTFKRKQGQEKNADEFAKTASQNEYIRNAFQQHNPFITTIPSGSEQCLSKGHPLPKPIGAAFKKYLNEDFADVLIHKDPKSTQLAKEQHAAALAIETHIFLNEDVLKSNDISTIYLLAHELFHTINATASNPDLTIQLKPLSELNDRSPEQITALDRAAKISEGEQGKVNSKAVNPDKTRVGWEYLVKYFSTTLGEGNVVKDKAEYRPGRFLEENIKYVRTGKVQVVKKQPDGTTKIVVENNHDLLPSWCGIFIFWALHKGGIHPPNWEFGKPSFGIKDQYKKGEYMPRVGDIVIKNGFNHFALVVKTDPETIGDTSDLKNVKVTTMNGNTAGSDNLGGQIQEKTHDYSYWDHYINPFFNGVKLTDEAAYQMDERLEKTDESTADNSLEKVDLSVNTYDTSLKPIAEIAAAEKTEGAEQKEENEVAIIGPKEIMAKDKEFKTLSDSLKKNAKKEAEHDTPENKAKEAQGSAISPKNERASKAKANKVEKLGALPPPKQFSANALKESILGEVTRLLKQKEEEASQTGDKPKINDSEIKDVKDKNNQTIQQQKNATIGDVEEVSKEVPNVSSVEERTAISPTIEDAGKRIKISRPENAIAKPIADERISLEKESAKIDGKMAENDIDEQQLGDSDEPSFTGTLKEKKDSQQEAVTIKQDYRAIEEKKLDKDKEIAKFVINEKTEQIHDVRKVEFGNVDNVKGSTKKVDEAKRKEIADHIESIYNNSEKSVNSKLNALETTVNAEFEDKMTRANTHFKENINEGIDNEFTVEWLSKALDRSEYNHRVRKVFVAQSEKYKKELFDLLDPLTQKIADTLNAITLEIATAKAAVEVYVKGLEPSLQAIGVSSAKEVMKKFESLEKSIEQKQEALTNGLANKYADGVSSLEAQFKEVMDSRKSWLDKAYDAVVGVITEILNLLADLKKALEQAAEYAGQIIKKPKQFFNNLVVGATIGFNNFVKNIKKHLINGALEWVTGEMSSAGITLPKEFDFKGILSIILQVLGISVAKVKEIATKVIGLKYVSMLEKGVDIGKNVGGKVLKIFGIIKKEGIIGLWEFIKEEFHDLKEKLMEEARNFIIVKIVQTAVAKLIAMLVPGAGFISAIKSLIDFILTLFAKARAIVNIIMGIIATFGQILAGNVSKVSTMIEDTLAKFLGMAITFLAAILGLGNVGRKMNEIIQKKIKDPITKTITKIMEKLKMAMTKLGVFKLLDKIDPGIEKGKAWVEEKKESAKGLLSKLKNYIISKFIQRYKEKDGTEHTLKFNTDLRLERHSVSRDLGNYLLTLEAKYDKDNRYQKSIRYARNKHREIVDLIGKTVRLEGKKYKGSDDYFDEKKGDKLRTLLQEIANELRKLPTIEDKEVKEDKEAERQNKSNIIPETKIGYHQGARSDGVKAIGSIISLDSGRHVGSGPLKVSELTKKVQSANQVNRDRIVQGHLINHELFGSGESKNLAPITKKANTKMSNDFEKGAKELVHTNRVISLKVEYAYGPANNKIEKNKVSLVRALNGAELPIRVDYELYELFFKGKSGATRNEINNKNKWKKVENKIGNFNINHDEFF